MTSIQNLLDCGANVVLQVSADELKKFLLDVVSQTDNQKKEEPETYLTPSELSKLIKADKSTLFRWAKIGLLKPLEIGGKRLYRKSDVETLMNGGRR